MKYNEETGELFFEEGELSSEDTRDQKKKKRNKNIWIWLGIVLAFICVGVFINQMMADPQEKEKAGPYIGVVSVEGEIGSGSVDTFGIPYGYQHQWTLNQIDEMMDDHKNKGMVVFIDSPGGGVYESDELYLKIKQYQTLTGRPVYAAMGSMAASGGYYIATPADKIYANRNTWTGSIGVTIGTLFDVSGLLEKYGIKTVTIAEGRNKAMGSSTHPLTKEQQD
ncbi:MAG: S49 family peptidase, partial [Anaerovorax sp.]